MELVSSSARYRESYLSALVDYQAEGRHLSLLNRERLASEFESYVDGMHPKADPATPRPAGRVPETTLWYVRDAEFIGRVEIRQELTPQLRLLGGHIGYDIVPPARRRGHATRMLSLALPVADGLGIDPALITCDADSIASRKVIEANGGVLFEDGQTLRFWVATSNGSQQRLEHRTAGKRVG